MLTQYALDKFLKCLDRLEEGQFTLHLPDGRKFAFEGKRPGVSATMYVDDLRLFPELALKGDSALAESYANGGWRTDNLQSLITLALRNEPAVSRFIAGSFWINLLINLSYKLSLNTLKGSKRNIEAHYDLGNEFYRLWLDPSMTYSSALYQKGEEPLIDAQRNKYDHIIDRMKGSSGRTLEIGCGWGGFAERAQERGDFSIKGITLSKQQHEFATKRLGQKAEIVLEDYRLQEGRFDQIISIEMFEAVGEKYWNTYFSKVKSLLKAGGKALIQSITIDEKLFQSYRRGQDFVRSFVFPGGMLPSPLRFEQAALKAGLRVNWKHNFGQDYGRTLEEWLANFDKEAKAIAALGYDEKFMRLWRFYLASCAAGFRTGRTDVFQFELQPL